MKPIMLIFVGLCVSFPAVSFAKAEQDFFDFPDEAVTEITSVMRPKVKDLKISDANYVGEETEEELADPLLSNEEIEQVLIRGVISVTAEWCGLDWKNKSFQPFMTEKRREGKTDKQMAYLGSLHGYGMGVMDKEYKESECTPKHIERINPYLYSE